MKLLAILALSNSALAQYNTCTDTARCDYQVSCNKLFLYFLPRVFSAQMHFLQGRVVPAIGLILHVVQRLKLVTWLMDRSHVLTFHILTIMVLLALVSFLKI